MIGFKVSRNKNFFKRKLSFFIENREVEKNHIWINHSKFKVIIHLKRPFNWQIRLMLNLKLFYAACIYSVWLWKNKNDVGYSPIKLNIAKPPINMKNDQEIFIFFKLNLKETIPIQFSKFILKISFVLLMENDPISSLSTCIFIGHII